MKDIVDKILKNTFCDYSQNIASELEINRIRAKLNSKIDHEYLLFLKSINGFELNGLNIYGTKPNDDIYVLGIVEQNEFWSVELPKLREYLIVGDGDLDFYCYSNEKGKYFALSKGGLDIIEEYDGLSNFLNSLINTYV